MDKELKVIITAETDKLKSEINKGKKAIKGFGNESEEAIKAFDKSLEDAKNVCKTAMRSMVAAITGAVAAMTALAEETRELRTNQNKLASAFESAGGSAEQAEKVYDSLYRTLGDDGKATEAAQHLAKLTTNQEDLAEWTEICKGVYAEFGDSLATEGLTEAINHTVKLGEVQGTLADALEWSGISVDEFNEELAKCKTQSDREKKIRTTLNGIYKESAKKYETNSKNVLKANEAQNKLNKSMAKAGDIVEPVNAELKELGAVLLDELEDPLKDVSKWLTNSFFPALKDTVKFVKNNLPAISGLIVGITTAVIGYKIATISAEMAEQGLTAATWLRVAAQKALNAVMNASPTGLLLTGLAALTAGLVAYGVAMTNSALEVDNLTAEERERIEVGKELAEQQAQLKESAYQNAEQTLSYMSHITGLKDELLKLAGANGEVQEKDRARVDFILGQLNEALGTEYGMVDGVIQNYNTLAETIDTVIQKKTANALVEAFSDTYIEALKAESGLWDAKILTQKDYEEQLAKTQEAQKAYEEFEKQYQDKLASCKTEADYRKLESEADYRNNLWATWQAEQGLLDEKTKAYDEATAAYNENERNIEKYMLAEVAAAEGNADKVKGILYDKELSYNKYSDTVDASTAETLAALEKEAYDAGEKARLYRSEWQKGTDGYTDEMVLEAERGYAEALQKFNTAKKDAETVGSDMGQGLANGLKSKSGILGTIANKVVKDAIKVMKKAADSHSPSKKTMQLGEDMGLGAEIGLEKGAEGFKDASKAMVNDSLAALKGLSATNFSGLMSASIMGANSHSKLSKGITAPEITKLVGAIGSQLNGNNTPIILEVDGKVFAQTAINTLNERKRQTGKLELLI